MKAVWKIAGCTAIVAAAGFVGADVPIEAQLPVFDLMITVASIVLAVTGAWLAVVYPSVLEGLYKPGNERRADDLAKTRRLFIPMAVSALIVALGLLFHFVGLVVQHNALIGGLLAPWHKILRGSSFALLTTLSGACIVSLLYCLAPAVSFDFELSQRVRRDAKVRNLQSHNSRLKNNKAA